MSLVAIFFTMVMAGLAAVGGGQGTFAVVQHEWVRPGLLTPAMFAWSLAIGQLTPGPQSVLVGALGYQLAGLAGAAAAVAGVSLPTWILSGIAYRGMERFAGAVQPFLKGAGWAIIGLTGATGLRLALSLHLLPWEVAVVLGVAVAVGRFRVEPVLILGLAAGAGLAWVYLK